jgi:hypothetical protein
VNMSQLIGRDRKIQLNRVLMGAFVAAVVAGIITAAVAITPHARAGEHAGSPNNTRPVTTKHVSTSGAAVANTWLIPDAQFAKLPRPAAVPGAPSAPNVVDVKTTQNGPASNGLLARLANAGLDKMLVAAPTPTLTDHKSPGAPVGAQVTYAFANGSIVSVTQQQLIRPVPYSVAGATTDGAQLTQRNTGTQVVVHQTDVSSQIVMISSTGLLTTVTSFGVLAQDVPPPLSATQLATLAASLDS